VHNTYRCMAGAPMLSWDPRLEKTAQAWADTGIYEHSPSSYRNVPGGAVGENGALNFLINPYAIAQLWYGEIEFTNPWGVAYDARSPSNEVLSHYNQVMWTTSTKIGCGMGRDKNDGREFIWCHYQVGGNDGQYTKHVRPPWRGVEQCGGKRSELPSNAPSPPPRVACFEKRSLVANTGITLSKQDNTLHACKESCKNDWNCKSFTRCEAGISGCWLKNRVLTTANAAAKMATTAEGGQNCSSYMQVPCQKVYEQRTLVADEGEHIGGVEPFVSYDQCKEICANTYGCKSFATCEVGHTGCWMKKKVVSATEPANSHAPPRRKCTTWREVPSG